ncbi:DUF2007 domain-containing protein [uncultured Arenimonas sp.]|jgi:hypothetical protein|uniref:putative signal transducing protein n=1 Tax=uncultured Arenimonas sp. TaxID=546226 RepID=UPI0030DC2727
MKTAYDAQNLIDAQLVCDLLHSAGIPARVSGAGLLGAAGELPAIGVVQVLVPDDELERARAVVADWDAGEVPDEEELERLASQHPDDDTEVLL